VKLDELIRTGTVQNSFVGIEHLTVDELEDLRELRGTREDCRSKQTD
jgi:low affinity Fe/Cu permease